MEANDKSIFKAHLEPPTVSEVDELDKIINILGGPIEEPKPEDGWFTVKEIADRWGCKGHYARDRLNQEVENGKIERYDYMRTAYYRIVDGKEE